MFKWKTALKAISYDDFHKQNAERRQGLSLIVKKLVIILWGFLMGGLLNFINVPAGWLIGAMIAGMISAMTFGRMNSNKYVFKSGLSLLGISFGANINIDFFISLKNLLFPLIISISLILIIALILSRLLYKNSNLNYVTALFCCIPGGASEVIGTSHDAGADERIVAAFHTARITLFVFSIPLLTGVASNALSNRLSDDFQVKIGIVEILFIVLFIISTILIEKLIRIPIGPLFISMVLSFLVNQFFEFGSNFYILPIIGQVIIGVVVGQKFDREAYQQIKKLGLLTLTILFVLFGTSFIIAYLFSLISNLDYAVSLLGVVPAGAAEMSSTAFALNLEPSIVAALQTARLIVIFLLLPLLTTYAQKMSLVLEKPEDKHYKHYS
jgi:uncharacterized protein